MALAIIPLDTPQTIFGGVLAQTPDSKGARIGSYVEVIELSDSPLSVVCSDDSSSITDQQYIDQHGLISRQDDFPVQNDDAVRSRLEGNDPVFQHLFVVQDGYKPTFKDWLDVVLVDSTVPEGESGWSLDGKAVHLYDLATSMRDARALGKAQRSMEAVGGDTSVAQIVQRVHEDVEAPISLRGEIHGDQEHSLFRPGHIYQTMFTNLAEHRHERFDRSTHFPEINLSQS